VDEFIQNEYSDPEMEDVEYISNGSLREFLKMLGGEKPKKR
jgi:hypothetical protein